MAQSQRTVLVMILAATIALVAIAIGMWGTVIRARSATLDDFGPAPRYRLTDQLGRAATSDDLAGKVVLADFVYTSCADVCPLLSAQMGSFQEGLRNAGLLGKHVQLLSFTVDPARDTPEVLRAYAERYHADPTAWRFLTGPERELTTVIVEGFHLGVQPLPPNMIAAADGAPGLGDYEVMHSDRLVLIDQSGRIRAYYDTRELDLDRALRDVRAVS